MAERKFFKDFTPGEIQYLNRNANGIDLKRFSDTFLQRRDDGTYRFDEMSDAQRSAIFKTLEVPQVKQATLRYDLELAGMPANKVFVATDVAQTPATLPAPVTQDDLDRREAQKARLRALADEIKLADEEQDKPPSNVLVVGNLTEEDRAIPIGEPAVVKAINLTASQQALVDAKAGERINLIAFVDQRPVVNSETVAAKDRFADYTRITKKETEAELLAAEQLALGPEERTSGVRITNIGTIGNSDFLTVTDNRGNQYRINREDYLATKNAFSAVIQEEENELKYYRTWAQEQNRPQDEIDRVFANSGANGLVQLAANKDYQRHLADTQAETGRLPFSTPATDDGVDRVATTLAQQTSQNAKVNPVGGGAGDKVESTGGADTAVALSDDERTRLSSASYLEGLKRDAISTTPAVATPTLAQSAVAAVEAGDGSSANVATVQIDESTPIVSKAVTTLLGSNNAGSQTDTQAVQNNPLDEYESYTYGLALHVLDKTEYDGLAQNSQAWRPQHTLIASAGRWQEVAPTGASVAFGADKDASYLKREQGWEDNFYFENLKMNQLQGPSVLGRSTNTIEIEFTLIEPYGLTLLDRMIKTANRLRQDSYMQLCYMLQIDFFDSEKGLLIEHRKYLPITLTGMNIKVSGKGSQYAVTAVPFHYKALMETITTTPLTVTVVSSTLREFFADQNSASASAGSQGASDQFRQEQENDKAAGTGTGGNAGTRIATRGSAPTDSSYQIHSYVAAYNSWWQTMKDLNATDPKVAPQNIKVRFADEIIKKEKLTIPVGGEVATGPMAKADAKQGKAVAEDTKNQGFVFKAGTNIVEVINSAMMASDYIRDQVLTANTEESQQKASKLGTVNWWKILPQVKLNDFDNTLNRWSYSIIYFVVPYKVWNTKHPNLPKSSPRRANCVKQYNYLYTGDNRSVIDFQVEFDMLYLTTVAGLKQINPDRVDPKAQEADKAGGDSNDRIRASGSVTPVVHKLVPHDVRAGTDTGNKDPVAVALGTIQHSIYSGVNGEMLTVTMKIIGDPTLLKQDDLFVNIGQYYNEQARSTTSDGVKLNISDLANNSIVTDAGEVLAWVQVLMPPDIDENTGGLRLGAAASSVNSFTGVYKILEVQNEFTQGKFTQTLILIRYQEQEADKVYKEALSEQKRELSDAGAADNVARNTDGSTDVTVSNSANDSSQVATSSATSGTEETSLTQTASNVFPPTQFNLLDTGNYPESTIEKTDLA